MHQRDIKSEDIGPGGSTGRFLGDEWAPCRHGCPVHADVRTYIEHAACGDWKRAVDVIRQKLSFAAVCGRICHHPCEDNCRRKDIEEPVAIREVKRFVAETQGVEGASLHDKKPPTGKKVAVIGAGPSGMSAALELAKSGHRPVVFDKASVAGGIPATTIPRYRLPRAVTGIDVDWICAHGVELRLGVEVGKDITLEQLIDEEGFDCAIIAVGLSASRLLPISGADHQRVYAVMDFLQSINAGYPPGIGHDVVVIGAGDVAMDAARSSVRLGAEKVKIVCLENDEEIPAHEWEVSEAVEEGVEFIKRRGPVEIHADGRGGITGLTARRVKRVFDENGDFSPDYDDNDTIEVRADTVIFAVGQVPDHGYARDSLEINDRGRLHWDQNTYRTEKENIFACGEIVTPPGSVVEACASGQKAAQAVDKYLCGDKIAVEETLPYEIDPIPEENAQNVMRQDRNPVPQLPPQERSKNFEPFESNYRPDIAAREARRCMSCGGGAEVLVDKCAACLNCVRVCPFDAPIVTDVARIAAEGCQACGICEAECPANAIVMKRYDWGSLKRRTAAVLGNGKDSVAYIGGFCASVAEWRGEKNTFDPDTAEIYLVSTASISVSDLLYAFERGAKKVVVRPCAANNDRYPTAAARTRRRVKQAQILLQEAGFDGDQLVLEC